VLFFMIFALVIYAMLRFFIHNAVGKRDVRYLQFWLQKLIFNDFLMLLLCCFFEFASAALISLNSYDSETNSVWNLIVSVCLLMAVMVGIPFLFM
jgi:hypothetical protein